MNIVDVELLAVAIGVVQWGNAPAGEIVNVAENRNSLRLIPSGRSERGIGLQFLRRFKFRLNDEGGDLDWRYGKSHPIVCEGDLTRLSCAEIAERARRAGFTWITPTPKWRVFSEGV